MSSRAPAIAAIAYPRQAEQVLEVTNLTKSFRSPDGDRRAVVDVARFTLHERSQVALHGQSGCGKTTFLNILAGIVRPDSGQVRLREVEVTALSESARDRLRAGSIGYVHQNFNLLQGFTALENVLLAMSFGAGRDVPRAKALLQRVDLGARLDYRPKQLSMGQQQRVAVARALANRPKLVLADEPTGNLDALNAREVLSLLKEACNEQGAALLLVTHDRDILQQFEDVEEFSALNTKAEGTR